MGNKGIIQKNIVYPVPPAYPAEDKPKDRRTQEEILQIEATSRAKPYNPSYKELLKQRRNLNFKGGIDILV